MLPLIYLYSLPLYSFQHSNANQISLGILSNTLDAPQDTSLKHKPTYNNCSIKVSKIDDNLDFSYVLSGKVANFTH
ncbi:hypothetical protein L1987_66014 [Smallanthus sonchifolius]|uniref:Uncharacterized protein n=1 Tax=Smallanthus sonchifolius TaxID=185202 RepID=A0ACB9BW58_9ASTR|nr:hypothetical protein L1987_66014 [Smallanthus sonchifolius]